MTISRGQMPRQLYGLGSFVKSIGKTAKKIVKSPIGKAALIGLASFGMPGTGFGGLFGRASIGGAAKGILGGYGFVPSLQNLASNIGLGAFENVGGNRIFQMNKLGSNLLKGAAITLPAVLAAAGVQDEQEVESLKQDPEQLKKLLERGYRNLNPNAEEKDVIQFVRDNSADGGRIGYAMGTDDPERNAMQAAGVMGLPLNENPAGVTELDLRETGGFIPPVGVKEKADDIPAMLSNNEFVYTADAVRGMGDGDVDKGAERMYSMMKTLENGGRV